MPVCRPTSARASLPAAAIAELAWGFQDSVVDVLATKTIRAAEEIGARGIVLGGGVAANAELRARISGEAGSRGIAMVIPRPGLCTDNGAMIGAAGARRLAAGVPRGPRSRRPAVAAARPMSGASARRRPAAGSAHVQRTLRAAGLHARHNLSQNFLADVEVLEGILREADPGPDRGVLEIGPGLGFLTGGLLAAGASVTAVELDRGLAAFVGDAYAAEAVAGRLRVIQGDALDQDLVRLVPAPYDVVANLPYHITSPILHRLLGRAPRAERLVLMVQREVAERIAAAPGDMSATCRSSSSTTPARGSRSGFRALHSSPRPRSTPPCWSSSRIRSTTVSTRPPRTTCGASSRPGFRERRKMLHNVLRRQLPIPAERVDEALAAVGIAPDRRPQTVAVGEWIALAEAIGPIPGDA